MIHDSNDKYPKLKPSAEAIDSLYPDFTPAEKTEAADTLKRYVALVWRIYKRISLKRQQNIDGERFKR
jgi:hypothetical protein